MSVALTKLTISGSELPSGPLVAYMYINYPLTSITPKDRRMRIFRSSSTGLIEFYDLPEFPPQSIPFAPIWTTIRTVPNMTNVTKFVTTRYAHRPSNPPEPIWGAIYGQMNGTAPNWYHFVVQGNMYNNPSAYDTSPSTNIQPTAVYVEAGVQAQFLYGKKANGEPNFGSTAPANCVVVDSSVQTYGTYVYHDPSYNNAYGDKVYILMNDTTGLVVNIRPSNSDLVWMLNMPAGGKIVYFASITGHYLATDASNNLFLYSFNGQNGTSGLVTQLTGTFDSTQRIDTLGLFLP